MSNKKQLNEIFNILLLIFLILFSLFVAYQILRKIFEGSWTIESLSLSLNLIIITSTLAIAGFLIGLSRAIGRLEANSKNLKHSFIQLSTDFKGLSNDFRNLSNNFKEHTVKKRH